MNAQVDTGWRARTEGLRTGVSVVLNIAVLTVFAAALVEGVAAICRMI